MIELGIILICTGVTLCLTSIVTGIQFKSFKVFVICILIGITSIFGGIFIYNTGVTNEEIYFQSAIQNQKYNTVRTFVNGIYKDKIDTKDGIFIITEYSKFNNVESLRLDQVITIYYIDKVDNYYLIDIKTE